MSDLAAAMTRCYPVTLGQRVEILVYAERAALVKFRLFRLNEEEPNIVAILAGIEKGQVYQEWPPCRLGDASVGQVARDGVEVTDIPIKPGRNVFHATWLAHEEKMPNFQRVKLQPWIGA